MRKVLKILHTLAACGLVGGLFVYMILLIEARQDTVAAYADLRWSIAALSNYVLVPSLAIVLISGLLSIAVHRPFLNKTWVWVKAASGILMFKGVLTIVGAKANYAAKVSEQIARGEASAGTLKSALAYEWFTLGVVLVLAVANIVLGVWRPSFKKRARARARREPEAPPNADAVPVRGERVRSVS